MIKCRGLWAGHVASMGGIKNSYKVLIERSEEGKQL
jgi:hypothetical protein